MIVVKLSVVYWHLVVHMDLVVDWHLLVDWSCVSLYFSIHNSKAQLNCMFVPFFFGMNKIFQSKFTLTLVRFSGRTAALG